jgi:hypothetical protein
LGRSSGVGVRLTWLAEGKSVGGQAWRATNLWLNRGTRINRGRARDSLVVAHEIPLAFDIPSSFDLSKSPRSLRKPARKNRIGG